jgi:hypothetical protein
MSTSRLQKNICQTAVVTLIDAQLASSILPRSIYPIRTSWLTKHQTSLP